MSPTPTRTRLRRWLLLPLLLLYSVVLFIAALPDEIVPAAFEPVPHAVRSGMRAVHVRPVAHVFEGRRHNMKRRSFMLGVHARLPDGRLERVMSVPEAPLEGFVVHRPAYYTLAIKLMGLDLVNRLMRLRSDKQIRRQIRRMRRSGRVARVARFACHSALATGGEAERIYLTAAIESISYRTGRVFPAVHTIHIYDCGRDRPLFTSRWPRAELDESGRPRPVLGEVDPLFADERKRRKARRSRAKRTRRSRTKRPSAKRPTPTLRPPVKPIGREQRPKLKAREPVPTWPALRPAEPGHLDREKPVKPARPERPDR